MGIVLFKNTDFYEVNIIATFILLVICQDKLILDWRNLGLLDYPYIFLLLKNHVQMWVSNITQQALKEHLFVHLSILIKLDCIVCFSHHNKNYRSSIIKNYLNIIL